MLLLLDLLILVPPAILLPALITAVVTTLADLPGRPHVEAFLMVVIVANVVQTALMATHLGLRWWSHRTDAASAQFWFGVLTHFVTLGAAVYYLSEIRLKWRSVNYGQYRDRFRTRFLTSKWFAGVRTVHYVSGPAFIGGAIIVAVAATWAGPGKWFFAAWAGVCGVAVVSAALSGYFLFVLLRDAAIRWQKAELQERSVAEVINSSFFWGWAAEAYVRAVVQQEFGRGR